MKRLFSACIALLIAAHASADWRMIVRLKPGASMADAQASAANMGGSVVDSTPNAPFVLLSLPSDPFVYFSAQLQMALGVVDVLWSGDDVALWNTEAVARGATIGVFKTGSATPLRESLQTENRTSLTQVNWSPSVAGSPGRTVKVAILDNGLSHDMTPLWSKVDASYDVFGGTADDVPMGRDTNGDGLYDGVTGHGTMVAGLIDAVAPNVRLIVAKVADSDGKASAWNLIKGLAFAVSQGAEIANVSLGSATPVPAFADAAGWAQSRGLLVVAAIGNAGSSNAWYPARNTQALCVAGLDSNDVKTSFSNYDAKAAVCAPAFDLVGPSWNGSLIRWSGTSFASPFVAAAIAEGLRHTTPKTSTEIFAAVSASGRSIDGLNAPAYRGKLGKVLDCSLLNQYLTGAR